eukprot:6323967-Pyramimonas_sp.AAC.1
MPRAPRLVPGCSDMRRFHDILHAEPPEDQAQNKCDRAHVRCVPNMTKGTGFNLKSGASPYRGTCDET